MILQTAVQKHSGLFVIIADNAVLVKIKKRDYN